MSEPSTQPLSSAPSLNELAQLSRSSGRSEWSPQNGDLKPPRLRFFYILLILAALLTALFELTGFPQPRNVNAAPKSAPAVTGYSLAAILSQGTQFYIVKKSMLAADLQAIDLAKSRGAKVDFVFEAGPTSIGGFRVPATLITNEGVLVNGARWLPLESTQ